MFKKTPCGCVFFETGPRTSWQIFDCSLGEFTIAQCEMQDGINEVVAEPLAADEIHAIFVHTAHLVRGGEILGNMADIILLELAGEEVEETSEEAFEHFRAKVKEGFRDVHGCEPPEPPEDVIQGDGDTPVRRPSRPLRGKVPPPNLGKILDIFDGMVPAGVTYRDENGDLRMAPVVKDPAKRS